MSHDDSNDRSVITKKELARELRRLASQKAKERRAADPRMLALKEAQKIRRREIYRQMKERRKTAMKAKKTMLKKTHERRTREKRAATDAELTKLITFSAKGSTALN